MSTHDISLPGNKRPLWPDICVACGTPHPGATATISCIGSSSTFGWASDVIDLAAAGATPQGTNVRVKLQPPACPKCATSLERRHFWKTFFLYLSGFGGAAACIGIIYFGNHLGLPSGLNATIGVAALLALVLAPVIWEYRHPPGFTITPTEGRVIYEFARKECAEAFAALNNVPAKS